MILAFNAYTGIKVLPNDKTRFLVRLRRRCGTLIRDTALLLYKTIYEPKIKTMKTDPRYKVAKTPTLKDITVVYTSKTGDQRIILTQSETDTDSVREAVKAVSYGTAIACRVERIEISKKEPKTVCNG